MESYNTHNVKPHKPNSTGGGGRHEASASPTDLFSSAQVLAGAAMSTFRHESTKVDKSEAAAAADKLLHAVSQYGHLEEKSYGKYIDKAEGYLHKYTAPSSQPPSHGSGPTKKYQQEEYEEEEEYNTGHNKPSYASGKVKKQQEEAYEYEQYNNAGHKPSYASGKVKKQQQQEEEYEDDEEEYTSQKTSARPNSYASGKTYKKHQEEEEEESGGGIGDYMKLAQGFMKSQGGGGGGHSAGGGESEGAGIGDYMKLAQGFLGKR